MMAKKSLVYQHIFLYRLSLKLFHRCDLLARNKYMASFIKPEETVLEPGCGLGTLANSLADKSRYLGFDLNKSFVAYGKKQGLNLYLGNVLKKSSYQKADVVVVCDTLHHLKEKDRPQFIKYSYSSAKRLFIFCDCTKETGSFWRKVMYPLNSRLFELLDKDGINEPKYQELYTEKQLRKEIKNGFGAIPKNKLKVVRRFGCDLLAVFDKSAAEALASV